MDERPPERLVVGLVRGLHGLRGAVRVETLSDDPRRFRRGSILHPEGAPEPLTVAWSRADGPRVLVRFREVPDREAAESLRDRYLEVVTASDLPEGAFYWHELTGCLVRTTGGEELGRVVDVFRAGGSEVFVVRGGRRGELLVPGVRAVVTELAPREGRIVVDAEALGLDEAPPTRRPRGRRTTRALRATMSEAAAAAGAAGAAPGAPEGAGTEPAPGAPTGLDAASALDGAASAPRGPASAPDGAA